MFYIIGIPRQNRKPLPEIKKRKKKTAKEKKQKKAKQLVYGSSLKSEETFNRGDSDFLVSKDGLVILQ